MSQIKKIIDPYITTYRSSEGWIRFRVSVPDGRGGQLRKQGFEIKALAIEWATKQFIKRAENRGVIEKTKSTKLFNEYAEEWYEIIKSQISPSTQIKYRGDLDLRILPFFKGIYLIELKKANAREFKAYLSQINKINNSTRSMTFALFRRIVKSAELDDEIERTGITDLPGIPAERIVAEFWDFDEVNYFLENTKNHLLHNFWSLAFYTGMRAGELSALKWDCVKLDDSGAGYVIVKRTRCQKTGVIRETTKTYMTRTIPLLNEALDIFRTLPRKGEFALSGENPVDTKHLSRDFKKEAVRLGLRPITFHQLRHSCCSWLENSGLERRIVSAILGHRDISTTNRYSHSSDRTISMAVERFERERKLQSNKIPTTLSVVG